MEVALAGNCDRILHRVSSRECQSNGSVGGPECVQGLKGFTHPTETIKLTKGRIVLQMMPTSERNLQQKGNDGLPFFWIGCTELLFII